MSGTCNADVDASAADFASRLLAWYDRAGRHDLPWQHPRAPYRVWVAEVMLQQTQVTSVIPYFERFTQRFPDVRTLAAASLDDVLSLWAGLGYYARARHLHAAARYIVNECGGLWPSDVAGWRALPGIGRSTAGAIVAQALGQPAPMLDANARRVFARYAGVEGWPGNPRVAARLWRVAEQRLPRTRLADYTQALMDLGAKVCSAQHPHCDRCPVASDCRAYRTACTDRIPARRPRPARRRQSIQLLLVQDGHHQWLLERRPPTGVWGGLWCPPLAPGTGAATTARREACETLGLVVRRWRRLPLIVHLLTHIELRIHPMLALADPGGDMHDEALRWCGAPELARLGLPAPVRRIIGDVNHGVLQVE